MKRRDQKHEELTGTAMLNEATKKAIVTEMAPPELATHLKATQTDTTRTH